MLPRFFAPDAQGRDRAPLVALPAAEATHLARVLRLSAGDSVRVFNGCGGEWRAEVAEIARDRVIVALCEAVTPAAEPGVRLTLALAVLKGDRMDDVIRDAVMLGAAAIQPLVTERTELSVAAAARGGKVERWQRIGVSSAKQCGRAVVPVVAPVRRFGEWLAQRDTDEVLMLVEPRTGVHVHRLRDVTRRESATLLIGPEGGWSAGELRLAQARGAHAVTLGDLTVRADAMPLVALTAIRALWEDI